ncbi:MarR family transcriptional regulator [Streptomyces sp. NPDC058955]|uniref:MarR family transcriptional regulator n=1 Tax=unclassified Streptomyces TaxID=2593676 RepID=UPI003646AD03
MSISSDDLVRASGVITGMGASVLAGYDSFTGPGSALLGLPLACCGVGLAYTAGLFQDRLRRRDGRVVAYLANNPDASLPAISAATGLREARVVSSLRNLISDGLVAPKGGRSSDVRSYRLAL